MNGLKSIGHSIIMLVMLSIPVMMCVGYSQLNEKPHYNNVVKPLSHENEIRIAQYEKMRIEQ